MLTGFYRKRAMGKLWYVFNKLTPAFMRHDKLRHDIVKIAVDPRGVAEWIQRLP